MQARSPQAKGRIERLWGTLQDRLVSELRLRAIATRAAANAYWPDFLVDFNRRFARPAPTPQAVWRRPPRDVELAMSCRYRRVVARDNTVRFGPRLIRIPRGPHGRSYARRRVEIRELLDGRAVVLLDAIVIATAPSPGPEFTLIPRSRPGTERRDPRPSTPRPRVTTALAHLAAAVPRSTRRHPWHYGYDLHRALKAGYVLHDRR